MRRGPGKGQRRSGRGLRDREPDAMQARDGVPVDAVPYLRTIVDVSPVGIVTFSSTGQVLGANQAAARMIGAPIESLLAQNFHEIEAWKTYGVLAVAEDALASGVTRELETRYLSTFGKASWLRFQFVRFEHEGAPRLLALVTETTVERSTQEALRATGETLGAIVDSSPLGIVAFTLQGRVTLWNPAATRIFGWEEQETSGQLLPFLPDSYRDEGLRLRERVLSGDSLSGMELRLEKKDGSPVDVSMHTSPLRSPKGDITGIVAIFADITEHRRMEHALRESEERYRLLVESAATGILIQSRGTIVYANPAIARILGAEDPRRLVGMDALSFVHPDDRGAVEGRVSAVQDHQSTAPLLEERYLRLDGTTVDVEVLGVPFRHGGEPAVQVLVNDITERKRAEQASRSQSQLVEKTIESLHSAIFILDAETTSIVDCNSAASAVFGYAKGEMLGRPTGFLHVSNEALHEFRRHLEWGLAEKGRLDGLQFRMRRRDGTIFPTEHTVAPLTDERGARTGWVSVVRDISEEKRTRDALRATEERLLQAQKMEAVGRLAGGVAHDFNNLLTAIIGYAETVLSGDLAPSAPARQDVQEILAAANRAAALTQQLLAFGRKQVLQPKVISLNDLIAGFEKMLARLIGEDISVVTRLDPQDGRVRVDPVQFEQVIMNLAVNARDAMPRGGTLAIETSCLALDEGHLPEHLEMSAGRYVMMTVSDTGHGMSADVKAHLFEPYFTTKEAGKGSGLGLSTVYGIVQQSGGYISVYSETGRGTTFKILLPRAGESVESPHETPPSGRVTGSETILLAEDEEHIRRLASRVLRSRGYTVIEASDGESALKAVRELAGSLDLLITDVGMPEMSGEELARRVVEQRPGVRVLFISGYGETAVFKEGVPAGMGFLQKPFSAQALAQKLRQILDHGPRA